MTTKPPQKLSLEELVTSCRQATLQREKATVDYCFELFRRAFDEQDNMAWQALQQQYHRLLWKWLQAASDSRLLYEDLEDLTQESYAKFWRTISLRAIPIATHFNHTGALLKYLKQCVFTTWCDFRRQQQQQAHLQDRLTAVWEPAPASGPDPADEAARLGQIRQWVATEVNDPQELLLLELAYEYGLKPREIVQHYPDHFPTTYDVRRVRERLLGRARRALST